MCVLRLEGGGEEMNLFVNLSELSGDGDRTDGVLSEESEDLLGFLTLTIIEELCERGSDFVCTNSLCAGRLVGEADEESLV